MSTMTVTQQLHVDAKRSSRPDNAPSSPKEESSHIHEEGNWFTNLTTLCCYVICVVFGHLREIVGKLTQRSRYFESKNRSPEGYPPLLHDWENFYTRRMYHRIHDCWNRPVAGPPFAGKMRVIERYSTDGNITMRVRADSAGTPLTRECVNLGSYNYLGFADDWEATCKPRVMAAVGSMPVALCTSMAEGGYTALHRDLENSIAEFVGREAACLFNMGWATNALGLSALIGGKGGLIISDSLNHNSIVAGARLSGAVVRVFKHNDMDSLEAIIRSAIIEGQERTYRPWKKIVIAVEGIYSMEGEFCDLKGVVALAKRYKCYVYLDEAHSIGATGLTGRGVCEHAGVDPRDIDIMMGTFTKSFGAMGGYIAGSRALVEWVRRNSAGFLVDNAMSPIVASQVLSTFRVISGVDGTNIGATKLRVLRENCAYFRSRLQAMGLDVLGDDNSPVVPVLMYSPPKVAMFARECLKRNVAVVVVGFPATPLMLARARFCLSSGHTRADLDKALAVIDELADVVRIRFHRSIYG